MTQNMQNTALLVMDMQAAILRSLPTAATFVANVAGAIAAARSKNIPVIYVVVGFRPGAPELNIKGKGMASRGGREIWTEEFSANFTKIHPGVIPQNGDIICTKRRISAFAGSDLEVVLRGQGIGHIVLTGYATSGVVLSTTREAADKDYQITVLSDGCADLDPEVHNVLTGKVFPRQADVMTIAEWQNA